MCRLCIQVIIQSLYAAIAVSQKNKCIAESPLNIIRIPDYNFYTSCQTFRNMGGSVELFYCQALAGYFIKAGKPQSV